MAPPLFSWLQERSTGVLLHPTCFPSAYGIGTFSHEAYQFLDFLAEAHIRYWQICPLGPTSYGDSPYQCFSAFAGNPYLVDLDALVQAGLLRDDEVAPLRDLPDDHVDFGWVYHARWPVLRQAFRRFRESDAEGILDYGSYQAFVDERAAWLRPFALFMALKDRFDGKPWLAWPEPWRDHDAIIAEDIDDELEHAIGLHQFLQYCFFAQWHRLRTAARDRGIEIIGDIPIFVALDSADVWANRKIFLLENDGQPSVVAGVPPDYFSPKGQLWGNPLYNWNALRRQRYQWWIDRLTLNFELYDVVRIDHFRGFDTYWEIPADADDARRGSWRKGPGLAFFRALRKHFAEARIIAEDLGELAPTVHELREATGLPGMAILQFAFGGGADNLYLPHNLEPNKVFYPGTHDNNTTRGWYDEATEAERDYVRRYFRVSGNEVAWDFIRASYAAVARLAVIPFQDLLGLGSEARFNIPGEPAGNWQWRYHPFQLERLRAEAAPYLRELGSLYDRRPGPKG